MAKITRPEFAGHRVRFMVKSMPQDSRGSALGAIFESPGQADKHGTVHVPNVPPGKYEVSYQDEHGWHVGPGLTSYLIEGPD